MLLSKFLLLFFFFTIACSSEAQQPVHIFWKDDPALRKQFYEQTMIKKDKYISTSTGEYAEGFKKVYENHFEGIAAFWKSKRVVTSAQQHLYLQSIVRKIIDANPVLKGSDARVVFTRDEWPNAVSMGDGSIAVNGGLVLFLENEAELAFIICHELAHYYLDHSNKTIREHIETYNSEAFKKEIKRLSKEEYKVWSQLEELLKKMTFGSRRHSRAHEAEADLQAFMFMKHTGYDCSAITTCLEKLNKVDDSALFPPLKTEKAFDFEGYPFKRKWIEKTSSIFAQMDASDSPLTPEEKDSLRTHPDCELRMAMLQDSIRGTSGGQKFLVNEIFFRQLKKDILPEIIQLLYDQENLARNLYYNLLVLENNEDDPLAIFSIARDLNILYDMQKNHRLGDIDKEGRTYPADYNLLLRMIDRLKLEEIAHINYFFCKKHEGKMKGYDAFTKEMEKAEKTFLNY